MKKITNKELEKEKADLHKYFGDEVMPLETLKELVEECENHGCEDVLIENVEKGKLKQAFTGIDKNGVKQTSTYQRSEPPKP